MNNTATRSAGSPISGRRQAYLSTIDAPTVQHAEIFTRRWVVEFILDLVGYTADRDLACLVAVEPACGAGAFLGPMVERLSASCRKHGRSLDEAVGAIRGTDLLGSNVTASRQVVEEVLADRGWSDEDARRVARGWVSEGDYLLAEADRPVDFVVGNPPYIRLEDVPADRMAAYRATCATMTGRSDIYVGFFEKGLLSLAPGGALGFICADRWMRNQYGQHLRGLIDRHFGMEVVIPMHDVDAFHDQVSAYPAVAVIRNGPQSSVAVVDTDRLFGPTHAATIAAWARTGVDTPISDAGFSAMRLPRWFPGHGSWPSGPPARLALIDDLNERFPLLEDRSTGTRVGIGVATGADQVFVTSGADVEVDRLLPLSMVRDTVSGVFEWSGSYVVNPWDDGGRLVALEEHPRLGAYLRRHAPLLRSRHVAGRRPDHWYRTIDKIDSSLTARPKLVFPDMKLRIHPVLDEGGYYPHHNLYYVVSDTWDLRVLGGLLLSDVAEAFIEAYAVKMRGGTLRFQAQYLRRIRVPRQEQMTQGDRIALAAAFDRRDRAAATTIAQRLYGINERAGLKT